MPTFNSWQALESAARKKMQNAMKNTVDKSFEDAHRNVDRFYDSPEGVYKRTGQLAESPEQTYSAYGNIVEGEIRLDTTYHYNPSGVNTKSIYNYAENGELLGNGGFWKNTKEDVKKNIDECFGKEFSR